MGDYKGIIGMGNPLAILLGHIDLIRIILSSHTLRILSPPPPPKIEFQKNYFFDILSTSLQCTEQRFAKIIVKILRLIFYWIKIYRDNVISNTEISADLIHVSMIEQLQDQNLIFALHQNIRACLLSRFWIFLQ